MSARAAKDEVVSYVAAAVIVVSIIIVCFRDTGVLLATKKSFKYRKKVSPNEAEHLIDADLKCLRNVNIMLDTIERDILPLTCTAVCRAANVNKLDGAAILLGMDFRLLVATTNQQVHCPLFDAATLAVQQFYESTFSGKIRHLSSKECVVILTHKPCQHGRSSLLAGNFHRIFYLFDDKSFPGSSESSSSSCIKANKSAGLESTEHPFKVTSISEIINGISDRKREKANTSNQHDPLGLTANVAEEIETDSEQKITLPSAKSMAISAATDSLIVTTRRRIDQLTKAYLHINDESLLHAKR